MIVITEYGLTRSAIVPLSLHLDMTEHRYLFDPNPPAADGMTRFELRASLDGLLVLERHQHHSHRLCSVHDRVTVTYTVCNPATRQWANLPALRPDAAATVFCGFYFHASSGEYRVLFHCETCSISNWYFCVVSAGGALPRRLPRGPDLLHNPTVYGFPLSYHGALHWLSDWVLEGGSDGEIEITAFDTISETFRLVPGPPELKQTAVESSTVPVIMDLLELDGELSIAAMQNYVMLDIWALQDYEAPVSRWTRRHRVNLQRPPWLRPYVEGLIPFKALSVGGGSAILVGFLQGAEVWLYSLKENGVPRQIACRGYVYVPGVQ